MGAEAMLFAGAPRVVASMAEGSAAVLCEPFVEEAATLLFEPFEGTDWSSKCCFSCFHPLSVVVLAASGIA
jgi:hypothetical protein